MPKWSPQPHRQAPIQRTSHRKLWASKPTGRKECHSKSCITYTEKRSPVTDKGVETGRKHIDSSDCCCNLSLNAWLPCGDKVVVGCDHWIENCIDFIENDSCNVIYVAKYGRGNVYWAIIHRLELGTNIWIGGSITWKCPTVGRIDIVCVNATEEERENGLLCSNIRSIC